MCQVKWWSRLEGGILSTYYSLTHYPFKALEGGTFMEAFSMLTGFPVQRIVLARHTPG